MATNRSLEFKSSNPIISAAQVFGTVGPPFELTLEGLYYGMLNTKFQASDPSSSEAENCFHILICISMV